MTDVPRRTPTLPESSNINLVEGQTVPNMSLLRYGAVGADDNVIQAYNYNGSVHYLLDVYAVIFGLSAKLRATESPG